MNINKNNYEAYFLDYHEGNLSPQGVADLFLFLSQHPELKKELDDFENVALNDFSTPVFENKESLKKNITPNNHEDYFIRAVEGTLDATELVMLQTYLTTNPEFLKEFNQFKKTKLQADPALIFENKNELKQIPQQEHALIASIEGLLNKQEQTQLKQELAKSAELKKTYLYYQQTKIIADLSIVFNDKQALKRKERKVVPLFYYISSAAAAIAIIIGLFFMLKPAARIKVQMAQQKTTPVTPSKTVRPTVTEQSSAPAPISTETSFVKKDNKSAVKKELKPSVYTPNEHITIAATTELKSKGDVVVLNPAVSDLTNSKSETPIATMADSNLLQQSKNTTPVVKIEKKPEQLKAAEFPSIRDLFASKLKKKLIGDDHQEKNNTAPAKISGWDIAGVFAKGLSNLTGKKIAVKPQFNKQGDVTAYALSAGKLEFSRIK